MPVSSVWRNNLNCFREAQQLWSVTHPSAYDLKLNREVSVDLWLMSRARTCVYLFSAGEMKSPWRDFITVTWLKTSEHAALWYVSLNMSANHFPPCVWSHSFSCATLLVFLTDIVALISSFPLLSSLRVSSPSVLSVVSLWFPEVIVLVVSRQVIPEDDFICAQLYSCSDHDVCHQGTGTNPLPE